MLGRALIAGNTILWALAKGWAASLPGIQGSRAFLFRRWVLESLLVLRIQGPSRYNDLALALGRPRGQSLSPKLTALREWALRVVHGLTPGGRRLAESASTLTRWKGLQARAASESDSPLPAFEALTRTAPAEVARWRASLDRYAQATESIASAREAVCRPKEFEDGLVTARRFCRAWTHKWHSQVLAALALEGPRCFSELRERLGIGNQALAKALAALAEANSIGLVGSAKGSRYAVPPFGWADLSLGAPLGVLLLEASGQTASASGAP
jgi:DNA-binding HxlR family transcriptional regulator